MNEIAFQLQLAKFIRACKCLPYVCENVQFTRFLSYYDLIRSDKNLSVQIILILITLVITNQQNIIEFIGRKI